MKNLVFIVLIMFVSISCDLFQNEKEFPITGVWLKDDFKDPKSQECESMKKYIDGQSKDMKKKYKEEMMLLSMFLGNIEAGKIVDIKKGGEVEFYGVNPMDKKKGKQNLNKGKWIREGNSIQISPEDTDTGWQFGTFIANVKEGKAIVKLSENKVLMGQLPLFSKDNNLKKCITDDFTFTFSMTDKPIENFVK
jgi:hypothetical protein